MTDIKLAHCLSASIDELPNRRKILCYPDEKNADCSTHKYRASRLNAWWGSLNMYRRYSHRIAATNPQDDLLDYFSDVLSGERLAQRTTVHE
jgi:hypothetical protein